MSLDARIGFRLALGLALACGGVTGVASAAPTRAAGAPRAFARTSIGTSVGTSAAATEPNATDLVGSAPGGPVEPGSGANADPNGSPPPAGAGTSEKTSLSAKPLARPASKSGATGAPATTTEPAATSAPATSESATAATPGASANSSSLDAQEDRREVVVRVDATVGRSIYLDGGREDGLRVGDRVWLEVPGTSRLAARILAVAKDSARAELENGDEVEIDVGTRGTLSLPLSRFPSEASAAQGETSPGEGAPAVPPPGAAPREPWVDLERARGDQLPPPPEWEEGPVEWEEDRPLLAPPAERTPEEKPVRIHGFAHVSVEQIDSDIGSDRRYRSRRAGVDMEVENPLSRGGVFEIDLDYEERLATSNEGPDEEDSTLRVDQLSYHWGGVRHRPWRVEVGRFRHDELPELGRIDGLEIGHRLDNGDRFAVSLGAVPERDDEVSTTSDAEVSAVYRFAIGDEERSSFALGTQHTWTDGIADRDLVIASLDASLGERTSLFGTAWFDLYGSDAEVKDSGVEPTRLSLNAMHRFEAGHHLSVFASYFRWPEIERYKNLPTDLLEDGSLTRYGVSGRYKLTPDLRLRGRVDFWEDQDDSGGGREVGVEIADVFDSGVALTLSAFDTEGSYSNGLGYRVGLDTRVSLMRLSLTYRSARYEPAASLGDDGDEDEQTDAFRASLDFDLGDHYDLSVYAEEEFEDEGDTRLLGFELRRRF